MLILLATALPVEANTPPINEIMYDPAGNDNDREFVEIVTDGFLNLSDYIIADAVSNDTLVGISYFPGSFSLVVEEGFNATNLNASIYSIGKTIGNNLNNDQDAVSFYYPNGTRLDTMNYTNSMGGSNNGKSLERDANGSWVESLIDGGTPGRQNSVIPICTSSVLNSSWSEWADQTECQLNDTLRQNRSLTQYDQNYCGTIENMTFWDHQDMGCYFGFIGNITEVQTLINLSLEKQNGTVTFRNINFPLFSFWFNFTNTTMFTFANITIEPQPGSTLPAYLLVRGLDLTGYNQTKNFHLGKLDSASNAVCIIDAEIENISAMSAACAGPNETIVRCDGIEHTNYTCTSNGTHYLVTGLHHSAVREFTIADEESTPPPSESATNGGGGGGGSSCPQGTKLVQKKCLKVVPELAVSEESEELTTPEEASGTYSATATSSSIPSSNVVEKDIFISLRDGKLLGNSPYGKAALPGTGESITGAAVGIPTVIGMPGGLIDEYGLLAIVVVTILSCGIAWWLRR